MNFDWVDYLILISVLAISFGIGIFSAFRGNKTPEEFLMGNRSLGAIPVAMSLLCSFVSAVTIIGLTSEYYSHGTQLSLLSVGCVIGIGLTTFVTLPVLYPLKLTSTHEYVEMRFNSPNLRLMMLMIIFMNATVFMGICLYATSIALAAIAPFSYVTFILVMGVVCTIYSTVGGIRAVVWTDVFQLIVMVTGLIIIDVVGIIRVGGLKKLFEVNTAGERLQFFNMNLSIYERHTFFNTITFGMFYYLALYGVSQVNVQRICAVSTLKEAKIVLWINMGGMLVIQIAILLGGLVSYAVYAGCDPFLSGKTERRDEIFPFLIVNQLTSLRGLPGIFVATLIASTLSSFSSIVNAQVALVWKDFFLRFKVFSNLKPQTAAFINKFLTFAIGGAYIGMGFLAARAKSVIQVVLSVGGIFFGSIFGVFLLGMCVPRSNLKGAWCGIISSFSLLLWIFVGALRYGTRPEGLTLSTDACGGNGSDSFSNNTFYATLSDGELSANSLFSAINGSTFIQRNAQNASQNSSPLMYVYGISYTLYSFIAPCICLLVGTVVSYITGPTPIEEVQPELITPFVRYIYKMNTSDRKQKQDLKFTTMNDQELRNIAK